MAEETTFDEYRVGYVSERHGVTDNAARALQLFEIGYTISGASSHLPVTRSTVRKYHRELQEKIHPNIVMALTGVGRHGNFDVWGERDALEPKAFNYDDGVADAKMKNERDGNVTDRQEQLDPEFRERKRPLNKGIDLEDIPKDLIDIGDKGEV